MYHAHGFNVLPVRGKAAIRNWAPLQTARQCTADIDSLPWGRATGIGAIAGAVSGGLVCVDFDHQHDSTARTSFLAALGLPSDYPWHVLTPGGGDHVWVICPDLDLNGTGRKDRPGIHGGHIELRYQGHYALVPPSWHPNGGRYRFAISGYTLPSTPPATVRGADLRAAYNAITVRPGVACATNPPQDHKQTQPLRWQPDGSGMKWLPEAIDRAHTGRNEAGLWLACQLRDDGHNEDTARAVLLDYQSTVMHQGDHPYTQGEALATLRSAYSAPARAPAARQNIQRHKQTQLYPERGDKRKNGANRCADKRKNGANRCAGKRKSGANRCAGISPAAPTRFPQPDGVIGLPLTYMHRSLTLHTKTDGIKPQRAGVVVDLMHQAIPADTLPDGAWFTRATFQRAARDTGRFTPTRYTVETGLAQLDGWRVESRQIARIEGWCEKCNLYTPAGNVLRLQNLHQDVIASIERALRRADTVTIYRFLPSHTDTLDAFTARQHTAIREHRHTDAPANVDPTWGDFEPGDVERLDAHRAPVYARAHADRERAQQQIARDLDYLAADVQRIRAGTAQLFTLPPDVTITSVGDLMDAWRLFEIERAGPDGIEAYKLPYRTGCNPSTEARARDRLGLVTETQTRTIPAARVTGYQRENALVLRERSDGTVDVKAPSVVKRRDQADPDTIAAYEHTQDTQRARGERSAAARRRQRARDAGTARFQPDTAGDMRAAIWHGGYSDEYLKRQYHYAPLPSDFTPYDPDTGEMYSGRDLWTRAAQHLRPDRRSQVTRGGEAVTYTQYTDPDVVTPDPPADRPPGPPTTVTVTVGRTSALKDHQDAARVTPDQAAAHMCHTCGRPADTLGLFGWECWTCRQDRTCATRAADTVSKRM